MSGGAEFVPGGGRMTRVYLDHNATTPLRPEAQEAMLAAMAVVGNPSSVHAEGRASLGIVQKARHQIAAAFGVKPQEIVFTSGSTEAIKMVFDHPWDASFCSPFEHDAVAAQTQEIPSDWSPVGGVFASDFTGVQGDLTALFALSAANSETGIIQKSNKTFERFKAAVPKGKRFCDATQAFGKLPISFSWMECEFACASAHKFGGPKGVGALFVREGTDIAALFTGGGQELGRRAGTENIVGIAGFGAAAEAAARDLADRKWEKVENLRNILENRLEESENPIISVGKDAPRLPNTLCFAAPGWKGETQVMQMDLAGFAISAGSACSSGKVKSSRILKSMGFDEDVARCAVRVSLGLETTEEDIHRFADAWCAAYDRFLARSAAN